jgi:hypothetical protein
LWPGADRRASLCSAHRSHTESQCVETSSKARAVIRAAASKPWMIRELFPCKPAFSRAVRGGHHRYLGTPGTPHEGHAPVVAVLPVFTEEADESMAASKGANHGPLAALPCKTGVSWGSGMGGHDPIHGLRRTPLVGDLGSRRRVVGESDPPLWQYFSRLLKRRQADRCPQRARIVPRARLVAGSAQSCRCRHRSRV